MVESCLVSFSVFYTCLKLCESSLFTVWQNREINESTVLYYPIDGAVKKNDGFSSLLIQKQIILTLSELDGHQIYWEMVLLMSSIVQQVSSTQPWRSWLMLISYPENSKLWIQGCWGIAVWLEIAYVTPETLLHVQVMWPLVISAALKSKFVFKFWMDYLTWCEQIVIPYSILYSYTISYRKK